MSLRSISEKLTTQNKLIVDFTDDQYQKNSDRIHTSFDTLNDSVSSITSFLKKEDAEEQTERSRERLSSQDEEETVRKESKGIFSGLLSSESKGSGKGLLGKIFAKSLGILVKSLPLIGLAGVFFADVVTGLLTAAIGDYDAADMIRRGITTGLIASAIFGRKGAIVAGVLGAILDDESKDALKEMGKTLAENENVQSMIRGFIKSLNELIISVADLVSGDFVADSENIKGLLTNLAVVGAVVGTLAAPIAALKFALKGITGAGKFIFNKLTGRSVATAAATGATAAKASAPVSTSSQRLANTQATRNLTDKQKLALNAQNYKISKDGIIVDSKNRMVSVEKQTAALKSVGVDTTKSAGAQAAKTIGKRATLGTIAKAIPGLSIIAGVGFGLNALMKGDPVAAGLHVASGIAGTVPGLGTAASVGLSTAASAREVGYLGGGDSGMEVAISKKSESLSVATRERDELVAKTSSNVIMDNSTTNNVSGGGGGGVSISSPITFFDDQDPYLNSGRAV